MKKKKNIKRNRLIVFGGLSIVAIIYFISSLFSYMGNIKNLKSEENLLTSELESLKSNAEELKVEIEKLRNPEYIARYAREHFSYSKEDGEYIIKVEKKEPIVVQEQKEQGNSNTIIIAGIGATLLFIIIYIVKKR